MPYSYNTCMSMTNMIEENSDRVAPRESRVMLPGQSHISRGMTVLWATSGQERKEARKVMSDALVSVFSYSRGRFEKEGLFRRHVVEKALLDRGLTASARRDEIRY
jgi:hypothetical protein